MALKKHGKENANWRKVRAVWVTNNPPNHEGFYVCGICGESVHISDMELDHIVARSSSPASRYELDNLQPTHALCNQKKGSTYIEPVISAEEYKFRKELGL